jgi:tryptophan synthase alpha chain
MVLEDYIREIRRGGCGVHMPHVYYGDPSQEFSLELLKALASGGGDLLEVGIPFSDPVADGGTFQRVCWRALEGGVTPLLCLDGVRKLRGMGVINPIVLTTYYNIPYTFGLERFAKEVSGAGVQGLIVPDMPVEESTALIDEGPKYGLDIILQVAPTTSDDRLKRIVDVASGFIYVINVEGVTGSREAVLESTLRLVKRVRQVTDLPVLAGFGVSTSEHARALMEAGADGVVAGSVYAGIYESRIDAPMEALPLIMEKAQELKDGCSLDY